MLERTEHRPGQIEEFAAPAELKNPSAIEQSLIFLLERSEILAARAKFPIQNESASEFSAIINEALEILATLETFSADRFDRSSTRPDTIAAQHAIFDSREYGMLLNYLEPAEPDLIAIAARHYFRHVIVPTEVAHFSSDVDRASKLSAIEDLAIYFVVHRLSVPWNQGAAGATIVANCISQLRDDQHSKDITDVFHRGFKALNEEQQILFERVRENYLVLGYGLLHDYLVYPLELFSQTVALNSYFRVTNTLQSAHDLILQNAKPALDQNKLSALSERLRVREGDRIAEVFSLLRRDETSSALLALSDTHSPALALDELALLARRTMLSEPHSSYLSYTCARVLQRVEGLNYLGLYAMESMRADRLETAFLLTTEYRNERRPYLEEYFLNKEAECGESLVRVSQYLQPILAELKTHPSQIHERARHNAKNSQLRHPLALFAEENAVAWLGHPDISACRYALSVLNELPSPLSDEASNVISALCHSDRGPLLNAALVSVARSRVSQGEGALAPILLHEGHEGDQEVRIGDVAKLLTLMPSLSPSDVLCIEKITGLTANQIVTTHRAVTIGHAELIRELRSYGSKGALLARLAHCSERALVVAEKLAPYGYRYRSSDSALLEALGPQVDAMTQELSRLSGTILGDSCDINRLNSIRGASIEGLVTLCDPVSLAFLESSVETQAPRLAKLLLLNSLRETLGIEPVDAFCRVSAALYQHSLSSVESAVVIDLARFSGAVTKLLTCFDGSVQHSTEASSFSWDDFIEKGCVRPELIENYVKNVQAGATPEILQHISSFRVTGEVHAYEQDRVLQQLLACDVEALPLLLSRCSAPFLVTVIAPLLEKASSAEQRTLTEHCLDFAFIGKDPYLTKIASEVARGGQPELLLACLCHFSALSRDEQRSLIETVQMLASIPRADISREIIVGLQSGGVKSISDFEKLSEGAVLVALAELYSRSLLQNLAPQDLIAMASVYLPFEQRISTASERAALRLAGVAELSKRSTLHHAASLSLVTSLFPRLELLFPDKYDQARIKEMLGNRKDLWTSSPALSALSREQRIGWIRDSASLEHVVSDATIEDKLYAIRSNFRAIYREGHLSEATRQIYSLGDRSHELESLRERYMITRRHLEKAQSDSSSAQAVELFQAELKSIEDEQKQLRDWHLLGALGARYEHRFGQFVDRLEELRLSLGEFASRISTLGFDFEDSFARRIFRGELKVLRAALQKAADDKNQAEIGRAMAVIRLIEQEHHQIDSYLGSVAALAARGLQLLLTKRVLIERTMGSLERSNSPLEAIVLSAPQIAQYVTDRKLLSNSSSVEQAKAVLTTMLDEQAVNDFREILTVLNSNEKSSWSTLTFRVVHRFSDILRGTVGQCLDYRSGANAQHLLACTDPHVKLIVGYDEHHKPRINTQLFLAPYEVNQNEKAVKHVTAVLDVAYTSDASALTWSKFEGLVRFAFQTCTRAHLGLFIPDRALQHYGDQVRELGRELEALCSTEMLTLDIIPASHGGIYVELEGFNAFRSVQRGKYRGLLLKAASHPQ